MPVLDTATLGGHSNWHYLLICRWKTTTGTLQINSSDNQFIGLSHNVS